MTKSIRMLRMICQEPGRDKRTGDRQVNALAQNTARSTPAGEIAKPREPQK
ncbi:MAG: hypothetical protein ACYC35_25055 [Pirellulales bacterium]